jgi:hypothetical protein
MAERHDLCAPKNCTPPFTRWRADFLSICTSLKRTLYSLFRKKALYLHRSHAKAVSRCHGKTDILQFLTDASLARPPSFPTGQLTFGRLAAGDCGHNLGNALFSSSVRIVFTAWRVLSPSALGAIMALFSRFPFPYDSHPPKFTGFAYADKIHVFRPFRLAALVCRPARCGCLTPYSIAPKRTGEFLIVQASKIGFPQKRLFVSRSRRLLLSVSYLLTF